MMHTKINIGIITCSVSKMSGGLLDAVRDLYKALDLKRINLMVYSYRDVETSKDLPSWSPLKVILVAKKNPFMYSRVLKEKIINSSIDILHIHGLWRYHHLLVNIWKKKSKKITVVSPHGMLDPYIITNQGKGKRLISSLLFSVKNFNKVDCYIALSLAEYKAIRSYGITSPIGIIPNGINLPDSATKYFKRDNNKHLLFLGRLHPKKGIDLLLEAVGEIYKENPNLLNNWVIDIVGWSQEGFDEKLQKIVSKYAIENKVVFHGGLFGKEKERMYATSDAYILPSHGEGLPMTVLEAWSWKLPVIMTTHCNLPEGFQHNAAIKIENNTESVKSELITFFQMNEQQLNILGQNGRKLVEEEFTWNKSAEKLESVYQWLHTKQNKPSFIS